MTIETWKPKCVTVNNPCTGAEFAVGEPCSYCGQREYKECKSMNKYWKCADCICWKGGLVHDRL